MIDVENKDSLLKALIELVHMLSEKQNIDDEDDEDLDSPMIHRMDNLESALLSAMKKSRSRTFGSNY